MKQADEWEDPLKRLINDHENISEYVENLGEMLLLRYEQEDWNKIRRTEKFFKRNVVEHFGFEEKIVFPAILSRIGTAESRKLIAGLQKEHKLISKELEEFRNIISASTIPLEKETSVRLNVVAKRIMDSLLRHASKEDVELLPIVRKNRRIFDKDNIDLS